MNYYQQEYILSYPDYYYPPPIPDYTTFYYGDCLSITPDVHPVPDTVAQNMANDFIHLSKKQLIQRVLELEREKLSTSNYVCCWAGCNTMTNSLHLLTAHIKELHIGSGKPAYYCQWKGCSRDGKPFLKRHKMQNHMRTHTGERPFECTVKNCEKRFSRLDSLNTHTKTHSNVRPYMCSVENCNKAYFHSRSLVKHAKTHHNK